MTNKLVFLAAIRVKNEAILREHERLQNAFRETDLFVWLFVLDTDLFAIRPTETYRTAC